VVVTGCVEVVVPVVDVAVAVDVVVGQLPSFVFVSPCAHDVRKKDERKLVNTRTTREHARDGADVAFDFVACV
jgi:hypothetical protein